MAIVASTLNSELADIVGFTVNPTSNGPCVGVKSIEPVERFEVKEPRTYGINFSTEDGGESYITYYREGSRVYFDGYFDSDNDDNTLTQSTVIFTLPAGFRPVQRMRFIVPCTITPNTPNTSTYYKCTIEIQASGQTRIVRLHSPNSSAVPPTITSFSDAGNYDVDFAGINYRCDGSTPL